MSDHAADLARLEELRTYDGPHNDAHAFEMEALEGRFIAEHHVEEIARLRAALARAEGERDEARADRERMRADAEELQADVRALMELLLRADSHVSWCLHRHEQKTHFGRDTADVLQRWLSDVAPITRPIAAPTAADPDKEG